MASVRASAGTADIPLHGHRMSQNVWFACFILLFLFFEWFGRQLVQWCPETLCLLAVVMWLPFQQRPSCFDTQISADLFFRAALWDRFVFMLSIRAVSEWWSRWPPATCVYIYIYNYIHNCHCRFCFVFCHMYIDNCIVNHHGRMRFFGKTQ